MNFWRVNILNTESKLQEFIETMDYNPYFNDVKKKVEDWAEDRNLIKGSTPEKQFHKLIQEIGELSDDLMKGKPVQDEFGDVVVVLVIMAKQLNIDFTECLLMAYNKIKDRKGRMINNVFVKEEDLPNE